jgi:hypothetical protein
MTRLYSERLYGLNISLSVIRGGRYGKQGRVRAVPALGKQGACAPTKRFLEKRSDEIGSWSYPVAFFGLFNIYSCFSNLEHRASVEHFVSLQFLILDS